MDQSKEKIEILGTYWRKWTQYMEEVRKQRYQAMRVLQYQNELQQRRIRQFFKLWQQALLQQKIEQLNSLRDSIVWGNNPSDDQDSSADDKDEQAFKMGLAIKYHQKKTYSKSMRSWIDYGITTKRFQKKLSLFYIHFLLKKYFHVINDYRLHNKNKKLKKAQILCDNSTKLVKQNQLAQTKIDAIKTMENITKIETKLAMTNQMPKTIGDKPNFIVQKQFQQTQQANSLVNFYQSKRSQFSTISANINYQSKRKFRPIMELPSIPDMESFPKAQTERNKQEKQTFDQKSPKRFYESKAQSQAGPYNFNRAPNLAESKVSQIRQEDPIKEKLLQILLKEKLISLAIMSGEQFKQGMQYENYRQKTIASLRKIRQLKIV